MTRFSGDLGPYLCPPCPYLYPMLMPLLAPHSAPVCVPPAHVHVLACVRGVARACALPLPLSSAPLRMVATYAVHMHLLR